MMRIWSGCAAMRKRLCALSLDLTGARPGAMSSIVLLATQKCIPGYSRFDMLLAREMKPMAYNS